MQLDSYLTKTQKDRLADMYRKLTETGGDRAAQALIKNFDCNTVSLIRDRNFVTTDGVVVRVYAIEAWNGTPQLERHGSHQLGLVG